MGGLGKTTVVNDVYQSPQVSEKFEKRAFIMIKRPFNLVDILKSLVVRLQEESSKKEDLLKNRASKNESFATTEVKALTEELKRLLETKSSMIVLDDLSSIEEWDQIIGGFCWMGRTTRIIVTTREENIAKHCSGKYGIVRSLEVLKEEDALNLFNLKVFGKATDLIEQNPELVEEAKQILKKCGGLPLAIVTVGGFLANRPKTKSEWRKLNENISAELEMNPELGMIRTVLQRSYDGLPYHLKSCFLYLSIFPEDHIISQRRLVHRWAAEGYSTEMNGKSVNKMAEKYFIELKNRSMILPYQQCVLSRKSIDSCKVHDLIREISISKSLEENLVFRLEEGCSLNTQGAIRRLAISSNWEGDQSDFENILDLTRIRSLSVFGEWKPFFISDKMRFLRVLDLEDTQGVGYHDLDHIGKLLHLKYLSLRGCDDIYLLPDSLGNLRQLQTLDIRDKCITALPKTIIKLQKLQYIHVGNKSEYVSDDESLTFMESCIVRSLTTWVIMCVLCCTPSIMPDGFNRRDAFTFACGVSHASLGREGNFGATMPRGIRKLRELHTLRVVNVGWGNYILQEIKMLTGLRKLGVVGINKKNGLAFCSAISNLSRLESLSVRAEGKPGLRGCLDDITSPPKNLESLKLYGNLDTLPEWIKELPHLVKLKLGGTRLQHDATVEFLGNLPTLEILVLSKSWSVFQGGELGFKSPQAGKAFGSLRVLSLGISNLKSVKFEKEAMPKLGLLQITGTVVGNEIGFSGLEFLPGINEVQLCIYFPIDSERIYAARDFETQSRIREEERQEERRKVGELKKKIQEQLAQHTNEPIVTVH